MAGSTTYATFMFQSSIELTTFLNTGSSITPGDPIVQTSIVSTGFDPGNGRFFVVLAPGY